MDVDIKTSYAEVMQVLKYFDRSQVMKIPIEIIEYFKENQDENYISKIDKEDIFNKNNISRKALAILAYLNLTYWADEEEKKELLNTYRKNEYSRTYNNDIFTSKNVKDVTDIEKDENASKNVQMIEYKESKFKKLINKIKAFFANIRK